MILQGYMISAEHFLRYDIARCSVPPSEFRHPACIWSNLYRGPWSSFHQIPIILVCFSAVGLWITLRRPLAAAVSRRCTAGRQGEFLRGLSRRAYLLKPPNNSPDWLSWWLFSSLDANFARVEVNFRAKILSKVQSAVYSLLIKLFRTNQIQPDPRPWRNDDQGPIEKPMDGINRASCRPPCSQEIE